MTTVLVVWWGDGPDVRTPLLPLQLVERYVVAALEGGGDGDGLESG